MIEKVFGNRKYFKILFIIYVFINTLALGYFEINNNLLAYIVMIYGAMILVYGLISGGIFYSKNHLFLIGMYGILLLIATYMNKSYSTKNSYIIAVMQLFIFLLLFGQQKSMSLKKLKQELMSIIPLTCFLVGCASLISLGMYFLNISGENNGWYLGLVSGRLFGIYFNCNPASFLAIITILLSLIAIKNHYTGRILYLINIGIQLGYVILSQCRAAAIILAIILTVILYYHFFRSQEMSKAKKIAINFAMCLCILLGSQVVSKVAFIIPQSMGATTEDSDNRFALSKVKEIISLTMSRELANIPRIVNLIDDVSSGRLTLTKEAIEVWQDSPIYGIGAGNFRNMLINHTDGSVAQQILHSHNVILESLVTASIFGCFVFVLFLIKTLFVARDVLIKYKNKKSYFMVLMFIMIFVVEFIGSLFDFGIFYVYSLSATLAWIFLGYVYWLSQQVDYSLIDNLSLAVFNKYELISIHYEKEEIGQIKPQFTILDNHYIDDDYVLRIQFYLGHSEFTYDVYYTLSDENEDIEKLNNKLAREFYQLIKEDIIGIYEQSQIL